MEDWCLISSYIYSFILHTPIVETVRTDLLANSFFFLTILYMIILTHVTPKSVHSILLSPFVGDIAFPFDMT